MLKASVVLGLCVLLAVPAVSAAVADEYAVSGSSGNAPAVGAATGADVVSSMLPLGPKERPSYQIRQLSTTTLLGVYRFETEEEFVDFWYGGGHPIAETGGEAYTCDFAVGLAIYIEDTQDEETQTWECIRPDGTVRSVMSFRYDLDIDTWYRTSWLGWEPYITGDPENPFLMDISRIVAMVIGAADPPGTWTINFLKNGVLTYSEQFELVPKPEVSITKAVMVTASGLGVDLRVEFADTGDEEEQRFVRLSATVNGVEVSDEFDVTGLVEAGEGEKEILFDDGELSGTAAPRILDFAAHFVPRFEATQEFELTAEAYTSDENLPVSDPDVADVQIHLPVVIVHGYMGPGLLKAILGRIASGSIYESLCAFLGDETMGDFVTGYTTDDTWYKTLWLQYYRSRSWSPDDVSFWLSDICDDVEAATYADRVDLVCHSLGGLIGRYYANFWGHGRVHKVIMIGTPNHGSSHFYIETSRWSRARTERQFSKQPLARWLAPIDEDPSCLYDYDEISQTWTELAPAFDIIRPDGWPWLFPEQFPDNTVPPPGVSYYSIYSTTHLTPWHLQVQPRDRKGSFDWYTVEDVLLHAYGDGTVAGDSAVLVSAIGSPVAAASQHAFLPTDPAVQARVLACLQSP